MFDKKAYTKIETILKQKVPDIINDKLEALEKSYKDNPYIKNATVINRGDIATVKIELNFEPADEEQNIVGVLEYGGVIKRKDNGSFIAIEPGYYIRRALTGK